ncbi:adenylate/guanylate cyclase domain-containing protein [PVC group bacterium]|nr:adenylate/guanylate cyclase domain-containing protein [PVC group bacterium]
MAQQRKNKNKKPLFIIGVLSLILVLCLWLLREHHVIEEIDGVFYNFYYSFVEESDPDERIVLIEIGDEDLEILGEWSWPRDYHAALIRVLGLYQPRVVAFDILFLNPGLNPEGDRKLEEAAQNFQNQFPVIFPGYFDGEGSEIKRLDRASVFRISPFEYLSPIDPLERFNSAKAFVNDFPDQDHITRRYPLFVKHQNQLHPSLALAIACLYDSIDVRKDVKVYKDHVVFEEGSEREKSFNLDQGDFLIRFNPAKNRFKRLHFSEILAAYEGQIQLDLSEFKNKIVIIGGTASGFNDDKQTPLKQSLFGMEVLATMTANILDADVITPVGEIWIFLLILAFLVLSIIAFYKTRPGVGVLAYMLMILGALTAGIFLFKNYSIWISPVPYLLLVTGIFGIVLGVRYFYEEKEKKWIRHAFGHYLSRNVMEEILEDPSKLCLGGEKRVVTVLFSDIRGFTSYCEIHPPEKVVKLLNEYMECMTNIIFRNNGTLDKYVGDEIMALFGVPLSRYDKDHAWGAVKTAWEMFEELKILQKKWESQGEKPFGIGVGINTGEMIVGNMGSSKVMNYTVIGDEVNLGARVEALTRTYDANIIITESTYQMVRSRVRALFLDDVKVKGKEKKVKIYSVVDLLSENA